jgi:glycosyltransferase involved in cell wall biosynthesis
MRVLYVSQNGMLEGLGASQVLGYLRGLARRGVEIDLMSFELESVERDEVEALRTSLAHEGIRWVDLRRRRDTRLRVKVLESGAGVLQAFRTAFARRPVIVHGRSHLPTAICDLVATLTPRTRLLFDCRGMLGDEYVDVGHWTKDRIEYRLIKGFETHAFRRADGIVVLTEALKRWLAARDAFGPRARVEVIPCCVDVERFRFDTKVRAQMRSELGLEGKLVLTYSGGLGAWYLDEVIAGFAQQVKSRVPNAAFLLLTAAPADKLVSLVRAAGFAAGEIVVRKVRPSEMPAHLLAGDVGISFIKSCFSKMGSSPTKVAEYLACGLPVVLNADIGDQRDLAGETDACVVLDSMHGAALADAAARAIALASRPAEARAEATRRVANAYFGLERVGVARYLGLYRALAEA